MILSLRGRSQRPVTRTLLTATVAFATTTALAFAAPTAAQAHGTTPVQLRTISDKVLAPFNLALSSKNLYVADGFTATVSRVRRDGTLKTLATEASPGDVAGVAVTPHDRLVAYTHSQYGEQGPINGSLTILGLGGAKKTVNLAAYEASANPDGTLSYGIDNAPACAADYLGPQASYQGLVDSHPYSVTALSGDAWAVADAGGNDLLKVDRHGKVSTIAVLPRQPLTITAAAVESIGLPPEALDAAKACLIGQTYNFESVPTDVEVGPGGWLYVSILAGGPEDPSLGARSKVYKVNPRTHAVHEVASGLAGATNLALHDGKIYVAELFAGRVSVIRNHVAHPYVTLPNVVSVEARAHGGPLYAGTMAPTDDQGNPTGPGTIVKISKGRVARTS